MGSRIPKWGNTKNKISTRTPKWGKNGYKVATK